MKKKKNRELFAVQNLLTFFQQKIWCISNISVLKFNETLIVSNNRTQFYDIAVICTKDASGITNSFDTDKAAPLGTDWADPFAPDGMLPLYNVNFQFLR